MYLECPNKWDLTIFGWNIIKIKIKNFIIFLINNKMNFNKDIRNIIGSYCGLSNNEILAFKKEVLIQLRELYFYCKKLNIDRKVELKKKIFVKTYMETPYIKIKKDYFGRDEIELSDDWRIPYDKIKYPNVYVSPKTKHKIIKHNNKKYKRYKSLEIIDNHIESLKDKKIKKLLNWLRRNEVRYKNSYDNEYMTTDMTIYGLGDNDLAKELDKIVSFRMLRRIPDFELLGE